MIRKTFVFYVFSICTVIPAVADNRLSSGIITLRDGTQYEALDISPRCVRFLTSVENERGALSRDGTFRVTRPAGDVQIAIPAESVRSISILRFARRPSCSGSCQIFLTEGEIELANGNTIPVLRNEELYLFRAGSDNCSVQIHDSFTGSVQTVSLSFGGENGIARIDYAGIGTYRWSESSQQVFPNSFLFDPYTGERTVVRGE